jgi:hypothetical protein
MSKYHYLIAGLPEITLDDSKQTYSVLSFKEEIYNTLSPKDRKTISLFFLKYDNLNLLNWLKDPSSEKNEEWDERGMFPRSAFEETVARIKEGKKANKDIPAYLVDFIQLYLNEEEKKETEEISWDDRLAAYYYAYAMKCRNKFVSAWFQLNLTIKNILTAVTCRKYELDPKLYIIGDDSVAENLKASNNRDFNLGDEVDFLPELLRMAEETDLVAREKKIDLLKWEWLDENTIFKVFDMESVFAYLLKIEMIERWTSLDKATGEATFRELIGAMKKDSNAALNEFKKKNNKI